MAKRRKVQATGNAEVFEVRRQLNNLLLILENISGQVDAATITATEGFVALGLTIAAGLDSTVATINGGANTYTGTGLELVGVKAVNPVPARGPRQPLVPMASTDDDL